MDRRHPKPRPVTDRSRLAARLRGFVVVLVRRSARLRLAQTAASLAFLSLLALVPIAALALSLLGALPMFAEMREAVLRFAAANLLAPTLSETLVGYLDEFAAKAGELSLIGAVVFFATAFTTLLTIERTLGRIWGDAPARALARRLTLYWTFLTLGPLLVGVSLFVNAAFITEILAGVARPALTTAWLVAVPWATAIGGLSLLYRLVPNAPVRWRDALVGALCAAVALELLKRGFAFQVARLPTYTVVYGTFATLPLLLVWLFLLWMTVLAGALVTASMPSLRGEGASLEPRAPAQYFETARAALMQLARGDPRLAQARWRAAGDLRELFDRDPAAAERVASLLRSLGYIDRLWVAGASGEDPAIDEWGDAQVWRERWMLCADPGALTLRPLFERLWRGQREGALDAGELDRPLAEIARGLRTESAPAGCP